MSPYEEKSSVNTSRKFCRSVVGGMLIPLGSLSIGVVVGSVVVGVVVFVPGVAVVADCGTVWFVVVGATGSTDVVVVDAGIVAYVVAGSDGSVTAAASRSPDASLHDTIASAARASTAARHCDMAADYPDPRSDRPTR
jgi:hypothetical protein